MNWISVNNIDFNAISEKYKHYNYIEVLLIMKNPKKKSETVLRMDHLYRSKFDPHFSYEVEKVQNGDCLLEKSNNGDEYIWQMSRTAFKNVYAITFADEVIEEATKFLKNDSN